MAILTVSRGLGSDGREIGQTVAELMGYEYVDRSHITAHMRSAGKQWEEYGKDFDEHSPTIWERHDWSFKGYIRLSQSIILNRALKDNVVIMGRGGNFLLRDVPYAFRIRIVASMDGRIETVMKKNEVSSEAARWLIKKADKEMAGAVKLIYGKDWDDPAEYDKVFNTGTQPFEKIINAIKAALAEREKLNTKEAQRNLRMKAIAAKVKAGISTNPKFFVPTMDVCIVDDHLVLKAVVHNPKEYKNVEAEAKKLAGNIRIECKLIYR